MHNGAKYQIVSMYLLPQDAWTYELTGPYGTSGPPAGLAVMIPDATPDGGPFTPSDAADATVALASGSLPWPLVLRFLRFVETSGDIVTGAVSQSLNPWCFADRVFEVTSLHAGGDDGRRYKLYEIGPTSTSNGYIEVRISDPGPADKPSAPSDATQVVIAWNGNPDLPWPIFRHFLDAIRGSADIVEDH